MLLLTLSPTLLLVSLCDYYFLSVAANQRYHRSLHVTEKFSQGQKDDGGKDEAVMPNSVGRITTITFTYPLTARVD